MQHNEQAKYWDLLVENDALALDVAGHPILVEDKDCIAQDLEHMIRESGLLVEMIGNRSSSVRNRNVQQLIIRIEEDARIVPGTVEIEEPHLGIFYVMAETVDFGQLERKVVI